MKTVVLKLKDNSFKIKTIYNFEYDQINKNDISDEFIYKLFKKNRLRKYTDLNHLQKIINNEKQIYNTNRRFRIKYMVVTKEPSLIIDVVIIDKFKDCYWNELIIKMGI
jgi:hypothetical protein